MTDSTVRRRARRGFLSSLGSAPALSGATLALGPGVANAAGDKAKAHGESHGADRHAAADCSAARSSGNARIDRARDLRIAAADRAWHAPMPAAQSNGDEMRHPDWVACYSKGLPHDERGRVDPVAYRTLLNALRSGEARDFAAIPVASPHMPLVNPQGGMSFGLLGLDTCQFAIPPAPGFSSEERAAEQIELHWMALARDIS